MSELGQVAIVQAIIDLKDEIEAQDPISADALLTLLKTVDGSGSGLDADLLDGVEGAAFSVVNHGHTYISGGTPKTDVRADDGGITILFSTGQLLTITANGVDVGFVDVNGLARFESNIVTGGAFAGDLYGDGIAVWQGNILQSVQNEAWISPTLLNGWVASGGSHQVAEYRKDVMGRITLRGAIKNGTAKTAFTLPAGYRPASRRNFAVTIYNNNTTRCVVQTSGNVDIESYSATRSTLDGVSFFTD